MTREEAKDKLMIVANYIGNPVRKEIIEAIRTIEQPWISIKDDLPCNHKELISPEDKRDTVRVIANVHGYTVLSMMCKMDGEWNWFSTDEPTHWMPLPEPPKE